MKTNPKGEKSKRSVPLSIWLGYLFILTLLVMRITFSSYITRLTSVDTASVAQMGELSITEVVGETEDGRLIVTPGVPIQKAVSVEYTATELTTYIFLVIEAGEGWSQSGREYQYQGYPELKWSVAEGWTPLSGTEGVFYRLVTAGETAGTISVIQDDSIAVPTTITEEELSTIAAEAMTLSFRAWAAQAGNSVEETWQAMMERGTT